VILIDTTPLIALCDPRDSLNRIARKHLNQLKKSQFAICDPVLSEACFHLSAVSQRNRLYRVLDDFDIQAVSLDDGRSLWKDVFDWLHKYADHEPDWADGYQAVLCGRDHKFKVWTYDSEFRTTWRRPDGTAVPMAVNGNRRRRGG
jgi:predicted nucleic acid-binding protein